MSGSRKRYADPPWKKAERRIARFHGMERNPLSGRNSGRVGDCYDPGSMKPWVYIEAKHYKKHAAVTLFREHEKDVRKVDKEGLPAVALCNKGLPGFYMLIKDRDLIAYAIQLLTIHGYTVSQKGESNAAHDGT